MQNYRIRLLPCVETSKAAVRCPPELPHIEHVIDVPEEQRLCDCGTPMVRIGEDVSEQLDIVTMQIRVIRTVRPRYACVKGSTIWARCDNLTCCEPRG